MPSSAADEVSCDFDGQSGFLDVNTTSVLAGQTYHVIVDSYGSAAGTLTLTR
jgi:hypothetical protein